MSDDEPPNLMPIPTRNKSSLESTHILVNQDSSRPEKDEVQPQVPVLLLTGYLGSGKTTLVNYILTAKHGYRCAVLLNEIGDTADAEKALIREPEVRVLINDLIDPYGHGSIEVCSCAGRGGRASY